MKKTAEEILEKYPDWNTQDDNHNRRTIISAMEEYASQPQSQPKGETKVQWTKASKKHPPINKMVVIKEDGVLSLDSTTIGWDKRITNYEWLEELPPSHSIEPRQEGMDGEINKKFKEADKLLMDLRVKNLPLEKNLYDIQAILFQIQDMLVVAPAPSLNKEEIVKWLDTNLSTQSKLGASHEVIKELLSVRSYILSLPTPEKESKKD